MNVPKVTIKTISLQTGFSVSTVSRVLNGYGNKYRISQHTQEIIKAKAYELNFLANEIARGLRFNKTNTIGLIVPNISNPFFAEIAKIITRKARLHKQSILLLDSEENQKIEKEGIQLLLSRNTDGIIIFPSGNNSEFIEDVYRNGTPVVLVDRYLEQSKIPYVTSDNYQGSYEASMYLLTQGHKNILCIQGNVKVSPNRERVKGFLQAVDDYGLPISNMAIVGNDFSEENGFNQTLKFLYNRSKEKITAIFALSNLIAMGAIRAIQSFNLLIPNDISLITFDDQQYLKLIEPPISSIEQPKELIGNKAIELLMNQINREESVETRINLPVKMNLRKSIKDLRR